MPCHDAVIKNPVTVLPDLTVESVIEIMERHVVSAVPVVDKDGILHGIFSMKILLKSLLPVSVAMTDGISIDVKIGAAPGLAKRLAHVKPLQVAELMDRKVTTVSPDAPLWEGVNLLTKLGGSLLVVDEKMKFLGMINYASLVAALGKISDTLD